MSDLNRQFVFTFSFGLASGLELVSILESLRVGTLVSLDRNFAILSCDESAARTLVSRLGGVNRLARILSSNMSGALKEIVLPEQDKFSWSIASYGAKDLAFEARQEMRDALKSEGLGKSKFLEPTERAHSKYDPSALEIDVADLDARVLAPRDAPRGIELVICSMRDSKPVFAETIAACDVEGYRKRDLGRPYGDPTRTLSPRLARLLVNLSMTAETTCLLDPFCGLGTLLAEALVCGSNVVGTDRSSDIARKARDNLNWAMRQFSIRGRAAKIFPYDARRISRASLPSVGAIASEPILVPIYRRNPSPNEALSDIDRARETYSRCFVEFARVLRDKGRRLVLTVPSVVDSSGRERKLGVDGFASDSGFRQYRPKTQISELTYPLRVETSKKRMVHRTIVVYEIA